MTFAFSAARSPYVEQPDAGCTRTLVDLLVSQATVRPTRSVYTHLEQGEVEGRQLSFGELDRRARAIAATLRAVGAAGERVLVMVTDELTFIESFFGVLYAGAVAVPTYPPLRPKHAVRSLNICADAGARFLLAPARTLALFETHGDESAMAGVRGVACEDMHGLDDGVAPASAGPDEPCFLQYTSGSTGVPKGVVVTHANVLANLDMIQEALGLGAEESLVTWNPLFHDMGLMAGMLFPLLAGNQVYLMSPVAFVQRPERLLRAVSRYRASVISGPNFSYQLLVDAVGAEARATLDLRSLKVALNGAEPVKASTLRAFEAAFGPCGLAPGALFPAYGLAEATVFVSGGPAGRPWRSRPDGDRVGHGTGARGQLLRVVSDASGEACAPGVEGEIWVAGPHVTPGYWNRPDLDDDVFGTLDEPHGPTRFLRTGDMGFLDETGELFVTGRIKDLIIVRGRNYAPADVERVAEQAIAPLRMFGGAAFTVERDGQDVVVVALEAIAEDGTDLEPLRKAVIRAVGVEVGVPVADVVFVTSRLPRTTSGKVQRHRARASYLDGAWSAGPAGQEAQR